MLSNLKDKLLNATKAVPIFSSNNSDKKRVQCTVNLDTGANILSYYQNEWETLHKANEENAKKAEEVAETIQSLSNKIVRDKESISVMTYLLNTSNIKQNVGGCVKQLELLHQSCTKVEENLLQLEEIIDNIEFEKMKKEHRYHLQQYKERKKESLEAFEETLKAEQQKSIQANELKKKNELEEKQQVLQEASKNVLENFKKFGTIPKPDLPKQPSALLEEILVDYDEHELDQFLNDQ